MATPNFSQLNINTGYPGVNVMVPANPISPEGFANVLLVIRGGGSLSWANNVGLNTVIITADTAGLSQQITQTFGSSQFPNTVITKVLEELKKNTGKNIKLGKFGIASFSAGYGAVNKILAQKSQLYYTIDGNRFPYSISSLFLFDGLHNKLQDAQGNISPEMKPYLEFAEEAANDPSKKFVILHSAIKPGYTSTTESAQFILDKLNVPRKTNTGQLTLGKGLVPKSIAEKGGLKVIQVYNEEDNKENPAAQHISISKVMPEVLKNNLSKTWGTIDKEKPTEEKDVSSKISGRLKLLERIDNFLSQLTT